MKILSRVMVTARPDDWVERHLYSKHCFLGVTLMAIIDVTLFGVVAGVSIWAIQMVWTPFWAAGVINGIGHFFGYRNFQPQDESRNICPVAIVIGGEELHNNHHAFPTSARLSNRWYEFDLGWLYIRVLEKMGLAKVKRVAPRLLSSDSKATCDLDTLQSIIANRLEVVSRFSQSVRTVCHKELHTLRTRTSDISLLPTRRSINNWLAGLETRLTTFERRNIDHLIEQSSIIARISDLRRELVSLWEDKGVSADHLVERLRSWCVKAERSGIPTLGAFARDLRGYYSVAA